MMNKILFLKSHYKNKDKKVGGYTPSIDLPIIIVLFFQVVAVAFVVEKDL